MATAGRGRAARSSSRPERGREDGPAAGPSGGTDLYLNRELSLLDFQRRVLEEAQDPTNPLLERVKFLAITGSNLDELFMVRAGGLIIQNRAGVVKLSPDDMTPAEQLALIRKQAQRLMQETRRCWREDLLPALAGAGIHVLDHDQLSEKQRTQAKAYFDKVIFPVLTPLAFDPGHPFPHISNLSLNLAVAIQDNKGDEHFARVKVPAILPRLIPLKRSSGGVRRDGTVPHSHYFVWIEQLIAAHLYSLFPGMKVAASHPFRVTRNADLEIQELEAADLLSTMVENVQERQFGHVVRVAVQEGLPPSMRQILVENLEMDDKDVYTLPAPLGLSGLWQLYEIERYDLKFPPLTPVAPRALRGEMHDGSIFNAVQQQDVLLHHPYDSFESVVEFLQTAAGDPQVLAIKQTLYRVGRKSPIVEALLRARREYRKQVAVLVELKARFDEESNIDWARALEREGVHVIYGLLGLKTHSKVLLVVRREGDAIRRYVHLGTGNYNHVTARLYEDLGMFTCDEEIGADVTDLFNYLTGYSRKTDFRRLLVAPINLRQGMEQRIRREIESHQETGGGHLIFKMNSLADRQMIRLLLEASRVGVRVDLIIRSICCLRPGVKGVSENIHVRSILGRFLEHSRIYYFRNGGQEEILLGSADLMPRNIDHRVEVLFPVREQRLIRRLRDEVLATYLADNVKARIMLADGSYRRILAGAREEPLDSQAHLLTRPWDPDGAAL
jgi:polyphosphate kinase